MTKKTKTHHGQSNGLSKKTEYQEICKDSIHPSLHPDKFPNIEMIKTAQQNALAQMDIADHAGDDSAWVDTFMYWLELINLEIKGGTNE